MDGWRPGSQLAREATAQPWWVCTEAALQQAAAQAPGHVCRVDRHFPPLTRSVLLATTICRSEGVSRVLSGSKAGQGSWQLGPLADAAGARC